MKILLFLTIGFSILWAQTAISDSIFQTWKENNIDFIVFDVRSGAADSIIYPCFRSEDPKLWLDSISLLRRLLISCYGGGTAVGVASDMVSEGFEADSIYTTGYNLITTGRHSITDTLCFRMLDISPLIPQNISWQQLRSLQVSNRNFKLVDVRTASQVETGMIPGACNIDWFTDFTSSMDRFSTNEDIILSCASGTRAGGAKSYLLNNGFDAERVINFGAFSKWGGATTTIPSGSCEQGQIAVESSNDMSNNTHMEIDVRPNPFNPTTTIVVAGAGIRETGGGKSRSKSKAITAQIYNSRGSLVETLSPLRQAQDVASHGARVTYKWDTSPYPSGIYILKVKIGNHIRTKRITLIK